MFAARRVLEVAVVSDLVARLDDAAAAALRAHVEREAAHGHDDRWDMLSLTGDFHTLLARLTGNLVLARFLDELVLRTSLIIAAFEPPRRGGLLARRPPGHRAAHHRARRGRRAARRWRRIWRRWRGGCGSTRRRRRTRTSPASFPNWAWPPARKDRPGEPLVRLLLYNPNTDSDLTARLAARLRPKLGAGETLKAVTAAEGPDFIGSAAAVAAARATLRVALAAPAEACDAVLLGCFGALADEATRRLIGRPIVSLSDAIFALAPLLPARIGIVATTGFWAGRLRREARERGQAVPIIPLPEETGAPPAARLVVRCRTAIAQLAASDACDAVVLGGAALAVRHADVAEDAALPVIDSISTTLGLCRAATCRAA